MHKQKREMIHVFDKNKLLGHVIIHDGVCVKADHWLYFMRLKTKAWIIAHCGLKAWTYTIINLYAN
jgi:hypothetical protein